MTRLVAFKGAKFHGKGTAADALPSYTRLSFATGLKTMLAALLKLRGCPEADIQRFLHGDWKEVPCRYLGGKTCRYAMQTLGKEWGRDCMDENFWVDGTMLEAEGVERGVIDDLRFQNEADAIRRAGGVIIHVERPDMVESEGAEHASETEMRGIRSDYTVLNSGTPQELHDKVVAIVWSHG